VKSSMCWVFMWADSESNFCLFGLCWRWLWSFIASVDWGCSVIFWLSKGLSWPLETAEIQLFSCWALVLFSCPFQVWHKVTLQKPCYLGTPHICITRYLSIIILYIIFIFMEPNTISLNSFGEKEWWLVCVIWF